MQVIPDSCLTKSISLTPMSEIEAEDLKPAKIEGKVDVHFYWQSPRAQKLMERFKRLKFGSGLKPLTPAEMETVQWRGDLREFINQVSTWDKNEEDSVEDYFHEKCNLFEALLNSVLPAGLERDEVTRAFVSFLCKFDVKSL